MKCLTLAFAVLVAVLVGFMPTLALAGHGHGHVHREQIRCHYYVYRHGRIRCGQSHEQYRWHGRRYIHREQIRQRYRTERKLYPDRSQTFKLEKPDGTVIEMKR